MVEPGPSSTLVSRATSAATSLMRSRSTAFSMRSVAQVVSTSRFMATISSCSLERSACDCLQLLLQQRPLVGDRFDRRPPAILGFRQFHTQVGFVLLRR